MKFFTSQNALTNAAYRNKTMLTFCGAILLFTTMSTSVLTFAREAPAVDASAASIKKHSMQRPYTINQKPLVEVVFVLDTTGSMGGLIETAKEKIWSIASSMSSAQPAPDIKIGLIAYRDRGDNYVTKITPLSSDLDSIFAELMDYKAEGGGDGPESVNQALYDAVANIEWSERKNTYKVIFLVGDAPPHMDYQDDVKFPASLAIAKQKNIIVNTIQCGDDGQTRYKWQQIAQLANGAFFNVAQSGGSIAVNTPYDDQLTIISQKLEETKLYYGNAADKAKHREKKIAKDKLYSSASPAALARRSEFNASDSGKNNSYGKQELLSEMESKGISVKDIDETLLPEPMIKMAPKEREEYVAAKSAERKTLEKEMKALHEKRTTFIKEKIETLDKVEESLEQQIYSVVKEQGSKSGLEYTSDSAKF